MERELREVGLGKVRVDAKTQEEVHFSSVRQAEQRNKIQEKEEHGAKRGVSMNCDRESSQKVTFVTLSVSNQPQPVDILYRTSAIFRTRMRYPHNTK